MFIPLIGFLTLITLFEVIVLIKNDPNRFALLCKKHHQSVEVMKMFRVEVFDRLIKLIKESR